MHPQKRRLLWLNVVGGIAVLGSYAHGLATHASSAGVWGGVPSSLQPVYTANMLLAATGYFLFSYFVFFRLDPDTTRFGGRFGYGLLHVLYALILLPSALWMPLTFAMLDAPSGGIWLGIRGVLALVGIGSLGLLAAIALAPAKDAPAARRWALVGAGFFCVQTALLDAIVWPYYFPA